MYQLVGMQLGVRATSGPPFLDLIMEGHTAVALFMTLSGFLFATICKGKEISPASFYRNRFLRIYPLFIVVLLIACYLDPRRNDFFSLMTSLLFLQNTQSAVYLMNGTDSLWAIAVEFQFYLLFPFLLIFFRKYGFRYLTAVVALAFLTRAAVYVSTGKLWTIAYTTIFGRIDQFIIGMMYGFLFAALRPKLRHPLALAASIAGVVALMFQLHKAYWAFSDGPQWIFITDLEAVFWGLLIVCYNANDFAFPRKIARALAYGGTLSFSLYLIHPAVMRLAYWFVPLICKPHSRFPWLAAMAAPLSDQSFAGGLVFALAVAFPITFVVSMLTYHLIEKPFLELRTTYTIPSKAKLGEIVDSARLPGSLGAVDADAHAVSLSASG
jgi:peptidoglycan/LPS O-acetylase OafA/YrhL